MATIVAVFETFGVGNALVEAVGSAAKSVTKEAAKGHLNTELTKVMQDLATDALGIFFSNIAVACVSMLMQRQNQLSAKLDRLLREPFETGLRVAKEALVIQAGSDSNAVNVREDRLRFATEQLDRALSMVKESKHGDQQKFIKFVQGLCFREMRGGEAFAAERLVPIAVEMRKETHEMSRRANELLWRYLEAECNRYVFRGQLIRIKEKSGQGKIEPVFESLPEMRPAEESRWKLGVEPAINSMLQRQDAPFEIYREVVNRPLADVTIAPAKGKGVEAFTLESKRQHFVALADALESSGTRTIYGMTMGALNLGGN